MKLTDFNYHLPQHMIAQSPASPRDSSKLMVLDNNGIYHRRFHDLPDFLKPGDLLILNESRVIPARLPGTKITGGKVEVLLVKRLGENRYECLVKGRLKEGGIINFDNGINGTVIEKVASHTGYRYNITFHCNGNLEDHLQEIGIMPLPPYIKEHLDDGERYQTVYSNNKGSIAAPTAGLHFTPELLARIRETGAKLVCITLHVGIGTFMPVSADNVEEHIMESEYYIIDQAAADRINETIANKGRIIVVGTTSVRALESATWKNGTILPSEGYSEIFIHPPHEFSTPMSALITNFHLPKSTLLMLVSAFIGKATIMNAYQEAINNDYQFYSFGDAMLIMSNHEVKHV
ncbi:MAG: tRNA preQ1(34) S-adenosylmethionine ribosyltransferase-isomerase QueA [Methanosarcinales archaeon]|nr:tRNA preQ1(34) S-adenosylmethionine ribosyltransferase-isomerase QueA [Methanosarcinales archaeon]